VDLVGKTPGIVGKLFPRVPGAAERSKKILKLARGRATVMGVFQFNYSPPQINSTNQNTSIIPLEGVETHQQPQEEREHENRNSSRLSVFASLLYPRAFDLEQPFFQK
jgi:hypothetical protein